MEAIDSIRHFIKRCILRLHYKYVRMPPRFTKYRISICCIFKDEAEYLDEWIRFHRNLGIDHIYAYNNFSTDNFREVLEPFLSDGYVTLIDWPVKAGQIAAYSDCINRFGSETSWLTFIDIDEFICPLYTDDVNQWLEPYANWPTVMMHWKFFGTSGHTHYDPGRLVIERFTQSRPTLVEKGKIFFNTRCVPLKIHHHHMFCIESFWGHNWSNPTIDENYRLYYSALSNVPVYGPSTVQLNHYWSKSREECMRKFLKGDAFYAEPPGVEELCKVALKYESLCTSEDTSILRFVPRLRRYHPARKYAVYTVLTGGYDSVSRPDAIDDRFDYILFSNDIPEDDAGIWQVRRFAYTDRDCVRVSRYPKINAHLVLPEYEATLYIDANITIVTDAIYERFFELVSEGVAYAGMRHPDCDCIYDELCRTVRRKYESDISALNWGRELRSRGFPSHWGMFENGVVFRNNSSEAAQINGLWWSTMLGGLHRDQLSLMYVLWELDIPIKYIFSEGSDIRSTDSLHIGEHRAAQKRKRLRPGLAGMIRWHVMANLPEESALFRRQFSRLFGSRHPVLMLHLWGIVMSPLSIVGLIRQRLNGWK